MTEIPDHIAVFFEIGNCTCHCDGCHSPELWDTNPCTNFMDSHEIFAYIVEQYKLGANAVVFMGGLRSYKLNPIDFILDILNPLAEKELNIGLYDGFCYIDEYALLAMMSLKWLKTGSYQEKFGGLDSKDTNQKFLEFNGTWKDKTAEYFQKGQTE